MKFAIGALPIDDGLRRLASGYGVLDRRNVMRVIPPLGVTECEQFQGRPHFDYLLPMAVIHRRHANTASWFADRQSLRSDKMERLSRRNVARTEFSCDMILLQRRTRKQFARNDAIDELLCNSLCNRRCSFWTDVYHRLSINLYAAMPVFG